jgi:6-phosphogluconolactonase
MIIVFDDVVRLRQRFADEFQKQAKDLIARREKFIVALPGGSVASAFLPMLANVAVDWAHIDIFWTDERAVPPDHADSNYALASRLFLNQARVPAARVHRMHGELPELDQAARRAADELKSIAGDPPRLDLALVGVGEDGHVASIFPDPPADLSADLSAEARSTKVEARSAKVEARTAKADGPVIAVHHAPKPPPRRLSLTLPVLSSASRVVVAAFGRSKAEAVRHAFEERGSTPIAELMRRAPSVLVLVDREAGLS